MVRVDDGGSSPYDPAQESGDGGNGVVVSGAVVRYGKLSASAISVRLRDDVGAEWDIQFSAPDTPLPIAVGTILTASSYYHFGGWSPSVRRLTLSSAGRVLVHSVEGGSLADVGALPPGLSLQAGGSVCVTSQECGTWQRSSLIAASESSVEIQPGTTGWLTDYAILLGDFSQTLKFGSTCADWYVQSLSFTVVALSEGA